jgi:hypothetical protein
MKVERLIVLVMSDSGQPAIEDDVRDGYALATKFLQRSNASPVDGWLAVANGAALATAGDGAAQIGSKHAALVVHSLDGKLTPGKYDIGEFLKGAKVCGMYIVMHGMNGLPTPFLRVKKFLGPKEVAALTNDLFPSKTHDLLKVNVVACTLAKAPWDGPGGSKVKKRRDLITSSGSWSQTYCKELGRAQTMVAAYTDAVFIVRDNNPEFKAFGVPGDDRPKNSLLGQKAVNAKGKVEMASLHRGTIKLAFQYDKSEKGNVKSVSPESYKNHAF